jgi:hypothetical protein
MPLNTKCLSTPQLPEHGRIRISMLGRRADFCGRELENILQQPVLAHHVGHSHPDLKAAAAWLTLVGKSRVTGWRWRRPGPNGEPPRIHCFKIDNTWYVTAKEIKQFWARAEMGEFEGRPDGACSKPRHNAKKRRAAYDLEIRDKTAIQAFASDCQNHRSHPRFVGDPANSPRQSGSMRGIPSTNGMSLNDVTKFSPCHFLITNPLAPKVNS